MWRNVSIKKLHSATFYWTHDEFTATTKTLVKKGIWLGRNLNYETVNKFVLKNTLINLITFSQKSFVAYAFLALVLYLDVSYTIPN